MGRGDTLMSPISPMPHYSHCLRERPARKLHQCASYLTKCESGGDKRLLILFVVLTCRVGTLHFKLSLMFTIKLVLTTLTIILTGWPFQPLWCRYMERQTYFTNKLGQSAYLPVCYISNYLSVDTRSIKVNGRLTVSKLPQPLQQMEGDRAAESPQLNTIVFLASRFVIRPSLSPLTAELCLNLRYYNLIISQRQCCPVSASITHTARLMPSSILSSQHRHT